MVYLLNLVIFHSTVIILGLQIIHMADYVRGELRELP
jgi:hypothetical protein